MARIERDDGGPPYTAGGLALAVPPDWKAAGEPDGDGMYGGDDLLTADGHKLCGVYAMGTDREAAFPDELPLRDGVPDSPTAPREDLTLDGRRAARYVLERRVMDGGPEAAEVEITLYRIEAGDYVVGMNAYPRLDRLAEDRALIEEILSTAAVTMGPEKT